MQRGWPHIESCKSLKFVLKFDKVAQSKDQRDACKIQEIHILTSSMSAHVDETICFSVSKWMSCFSPKGPVAKITLFLSIRRLGKHYFCWSGFAENISFVNSIEKSWSQQWVFEGTLRLAWLWRPSISVLITNPTVFHTLLRDDSHQVPRGEGWGGVGEGYYVRVVLYE